jgi:hypothetical protein
VEIASIRGEGKMTDKPNNGGGVIKPETIDSMRTEVSAVEAFYRQRLDAGAKADILSTALLRAGCRGLLHVYGNVPRARLHVNEFVKGWFDGAYDAPNYPPRIGDQ